MMMQCSATGELVTPRRVEKETIHSGHFMVSHFEAEAQVDEDELIVPGLDDDVKTKILDDSSNQTERISDTVDLESMNKKMSHHQQLSIETNLTKLFQCMSLAYRQKLTSPKWNRFKGVRLRWKDKIRLNNLIWRCWHMQFIMKQNTLVCQFASPLDVDTHNKPEAVVLEGKYWKRRLAAVTAEYKKWRLFHRNRVLGCLHKDTCEVLSDMDILDWQSQNNDSMHMLVDEDYMTLMTDTLFSTISANQPYAFPDSREIARAGLADFIQPSLGPLQPNLEDFMDTLEPLQELISGSKLPSVPEENVDDSYRPLNQSYSELDLLTTSSSDVSSIQPSSVHYVPDKSFSQSAEMQSGYNISTGNQLVENFVQLYTSSDSQTDEMLNRSSKTLNRFDKNSKREMQLQLVHGPAAQDIQQISAPQHIISQTQFQNFQILDIRSTTSPNQTAFKIPTTLSSTSTTSRQSYKLSNPSRNINFSTAQNLNAVSNNQAINNFKVPIVDTKQNWSPPSAPVQQTYANQTSKSTESDAIQVNDAIHGNVGFVVSGTKYNTKQRMRVRSSSLEPRQTPTPLKPSISDPALLTNANSVLLAQLLTNNSQNVYNTNTTSGTVSEKLNTTGVLAHSSSSNSASTSSMQILSMPNQSNITTTLLITPVVGISSQSNNTNVTQNQILINPLNSSSSHTTTPSPQSSMSLESPTSPLSPSNSPGTRDVPHREQRRVGHIHAEQKRRYNIKNGFEMLHSLIPQLNQNPNVKLSKAAMLQKGAEYIRQLRNERTQLNEEIESLRQQIECLNSSISNCQSLLPATGAPVSRQRANKMKEMFDEYVRTRTLMNWKFWVFSILFEPLLTSYNNAVSTSSMDDLYRSTLLWVEQHCSLVDLRPVVLNSLRLLSTKTEILSDPARLPDEARQAVMKTQRQCQQ